MAELEAESAKEKTRLEIDNDCLRLELADRNRRLRMYENSDAPSSTDSICNSERAAFRKKMAKQ